MLRHPITEDDVRAYERDGVVCIRGQFDAGLVKKARKICVEHSTGTAPTLVAADDADGGPGRTIVSSHMARTRPGFMGLVLRSPAAEIAARLMVVPEVRYFYDQLFIKEPGTQAPTDWHHDLPFWPFKGNHIASVWIALTPVNQENSGLVYVAGSHKWNTLYRPDPAPPRENFLKGDSANLPPCPAFHKEFNNPEYRFLSWDMESGDCLVHHPLTVHGAGPSASLEQRRVALSIRYFGGDAKWAAPQTAFTVPGTEKAAAAGLVPGEFPSNEDIFPVIWRDNEAAGTG
ncbi:MAG: hypothetical protein CMM16_01040 [Rhodospirillaceae bacterium]|nr:hypothetical protein [Rhodospirillaceae bacterium]